MVQINPLREWFKIIMVISQREHLKMSPTPKPSFWGSIAAQSSFPFWLGSPANINNDSYINRFQSLSCNLHRRSSSVQHFVTQEKFSLTLAPIFKRPRCPRHPQPSALECWQKYFCTQLSKLEVFNQNHGDSKPHDEGQCLRSTRRSACPLQLLRNMYFLPQKYFVQIFGLQQFATHRSWDTGRSDHAPPGS